MRLAEAEEGVEYAIRIGGYGSLTQALMLRVETVEVKSYTGYGSHALTKQQKVARMRVIGSSFYNRPMGYPETGVEGEIYVRGRDIQWTWEQEAKGRVAAQEYEERTARERSESAARFEDLSVRVARLGVEGEMQCGIGHAHDEATLGLDTLDALVKVAEGQQR